MADLHFGTHILRHHIIYRDGSNSQRMIFFFYLWMHLDLSLKYSKTKGKKMPRDLGMSYGVSNASQVSSFKKLVYC